VPEIAVPPPLLLLLSHMESLAAQSSTAIASSLSGRACKSLGSGALPLTRSTPAQCLHRRSVSPGAGFRPLFPLQLQQRRRLSKTFCLHRESLPVPQSATASYTTCRLLLGMVPMRSNFESLQRTLRERSKLTRQQPPTSAHLRANSCAASSRGGPPK